MLEEAIMIHFKVLFFAFFTNLVAKERERRPCKLHLPADALCEYHGLQEFCHSFFLLSAALSSVFSEHLMACQLQGLSGRMNIHFQTSQIDSNCPVQQIPAADHPYTVFLDRGQEISACMCTTAFMHACLMIEFYFYKDK
jgi:hypothetical protein